MEIFAIFVAVGLVGYIAERRERRALFPDQQCGYCQLGIYFDHKGGLWLHQNGKQYATRQGSTLTHPALPPYRPPQYLS